MDDADLAQLREERAWAEYARLQAFRAARDSEPARLACRECGATLAPHRRRQGCCSECDDSG